MTGVRPNDQLITDANKAFYALTAAEYDKIGRGMVVQVSKTNAANILARVPNIDPSTTELLDFAAGTGLLAMLLAPRCKVVTALDQSDAMIQQLHNKLDSQSGAEKISNIIPIVVDILDQDTTRQKLNGKQFDVITCTNAYHHISDPKKVTQALAKHLKPGGYMAVVDLIKTQRSAEFHNAPRTYERQDGSHKQIEEFDVKDEQATHGQHHSGHHHGHGHEASPSHSHSHASHEHHNVIAHRGGFTPAEMEDFFTAANLKLVDMGKSAQFVKDGKTYDNFLAIAQKPC